MKTVLFPSSTDYQSGKNKLYIFVTFHPDINTTIANFLYIPYISVIAKIFLSQIEFTD
jgi:hypothetical protein